jgi:exopolyphosphatase / guanosine-5'-triphosphate,3'-diphosphate pyrophosphatase
MSRLSGGPTAADAPPAWPLRAAAVDVGSNAIRLVVAEFDDAAPPRVLAEVREAVRLGHEVFLSGRLAETAMDAAVAAIAGFRRRMETLGVDAYRAVATSATREARNGEALVRRVRDEAGIDLEVITGAEEARLVSLAVRAAVPLGTARWLLVDLGGGSVEVSLVDASGTRWSESHTMGSVRLLEELSASDEDPGRFERLLSEYAGALRIGAVAEQWRPVGMIATGGNIEALARLAGRAPAPGRPATLELATLGRLVETLSRLSFRQRVEELGLREDRADVILPAGLVYERIAALAGIREILVPGVGLKEGLLADLLDDLATHRAHEDRREAQAYEGALALGRRYLFDEAHATHVADLAASLFDQLGALHALEAPDRGLLRVAAALHDIGIFVGHRKHHKHALYLISQSELPGLSPREIEIVANVARYHRKGVPAPHHEALQRLPEEDRGRVARLASLLRVADALDREHRQRVHAVRASVVDGRLSLALAGEGEFLLERWALRRKAGLLEETLGVGVEVAPP